jgi:hypothetical protein
MQECSKYVVNQILKYFKEKSFQLRLFADNCQKLDIKILFLFKEIVIYKSENYKQKSNIKLSSIRFKVGSAIKWLFHIAELMVKFGLSRITSFDGTFITPFIIKKFKYECQKRQTFSKINYSAISHFLIHPKGLWIECEI